MENFRRAMVVLAHWVILSPAYAASPADDGQREAFASLSEYRRTLASANNHCSLGFLGTGTPFTITRVSDWSRDTGIAEADQLLKVNGRTIADVADLHAALYEMEFLDIVTLDLNRNDEVYRVYARCQDGTSVIHARQEALIHASQGRWEECIRATYMEEILWGGANSQSAALRLWCHQARGLAESTEEDLPAGSGVLSRLGAHFIFEHAERLLEEYQHVPGGIDGLRMTLYDTIRQLDDSGFLLLANELDAKFSALDRKLVARR